MELVCPSCLGRFDPIDDEKWLSGTIDAHCKNCGMIIVRKEDGDIRTEVSCPKCQKRHDQPIRKPVAEHEAREFRCDCGVMLQLNRDCIGELLVVEEKPQDIEPSAIEIWVPEQIRVWRLPRPYFDFYYHRLGGAKGIAGILAWAFVCVAPMLVIIDGEQGREWIQITTAVVWLLAGVIVLLIAAFGLSGLLPNHIVTSGVSYELTRDRLRLRIGRPRLPRGGYCRELMLSEVERVDCMRVPWHEGVGHVVFYRAGKHKCKPAIIYNDDETRDDRELTFWLVKNPELVRDRVLEVKRRLDPSTRGPYRG